MLVKKSLKALDQTGLSTLVIAGGVGANKALRESLNNACKRVGASVYYPEIEFCTDNGAMIAIAGAMRIQAKRELPTKNYSFEVNPRWPLDQINLKD